MKSADTFKLPLEFSNVKKHNRLQYLIASLRVNKHNIPPTIQVSRRTGFDNTKGYKFPLENTNCYICSGIATIRHHVRPISKGGRNKRNNIVPLCNKCHCDVHPHMQKGYKMEPKPVHVKPLGKPKQLIVVIPPKIE